ncbi:MAG: hypothetical protein CFE23_12410 [Flavobacterium sp. BFFFF1]|uniref:hypothetical protein n=1 Tax=Flavobacterium sp. BFFFF1 TaxID=2015557 RepID=UPI000BD7D0AB|nr:hypothetical protein [Flavobacterium sp. BFFFF1]OYU79809.1 MAG: hypothetical protein CFE23_12410 [Flavobacterium sp. BFFFF1]
MDKLIGYFYAKTTGLIANPNYLMLLAFFNAALLMNFHSFYRTNLFAALLLLFFGFVSAVDFRFWWASLINTVLAVYFFVPKFPRLANHSNIELVAGTIIIVLLLMKIRKPSLRISGHLITQIFRVSLVTIYFYTGFHKLNTDFLDSSVSCVNRINEYALENLTGNNIILTKTASHLLQLATLFVELILPFGLLWRKTRKATAAVLLVFHGYLAFTVFADFSALACFMILGCLVDPGVKSLHPKTAFYLRIYLFFTVISLAARPFLDRFLMAEKVPFLHGVIFNIGVLIFFIHYLRNYAASADETRPKKITLPLLCVLIISFWSMKSYIGLGNSGNLTMFSNLITEKSRSNHLLIDTKRTKIVNLEEDNLFILELDNRLQYEKLQGYFLPVSEFKFKAANWAKRFKNIHCKLVYQGDTIKTANLSETDFTKTDWWYRLVNFRKIQPDGACKCLW